MLSGKKTYIAAAFAFLAALCGYLADGMDWRQALQLAFTAIFAATLRDGIKQRVKVEVTAAETVGIGAADSGSKFQRINCVPLACLAALLLAMTCAGCQYADLGLDPLRGVCAVSKDGQWSACWHPVTGRLTARHLGTGRTTVLEYNPRTRDYRAALSSAEGALVYSPDTGLTLTGPAK